MTKHAERYNTGDDFKLARKLAAELYGLPTERKSYVHGYLNGAAHVHGGPVSSRDRDKWVVPRATMDQCRALLREASPHVSRQRDRGAHEQDREDAADLWLRISAFLEQARP